MTGGVEKALDCGRQEDKSEGDTNDGVDDTKYLASRGDGVDVAVTNGGDYGHGEEDAISKTPVIDISILVKTTDTQTPVLLG